MTTKLQPELANPAHPYWTAPRHRWLAAGTETSRPYPCMCQGRKPCRRPTPEQGGCPCFGRIDVDTTPLPTNCCAVKTATYATEKGQP